MQLAGWFLTQVGAHDLANQAIREGIADAHACNVVTHGNSRVIANRAPQSPFCSAIAPRPR
jgi:predicted transcriptional regulator